MEKKVDIYTFTDYREFLSVVCKNLKDEDKKNSHRYIAREIGASSSGWLSDIISGRINCTEKFIYKLAQFLKMTDKEKEYFELLVKYNQAGTIEEKENYLKKLQLFSDAHSKVIFADNFAFYRKWFIPAIRELLMYYNFSDDYKSLAAQLNPSITVREAKEAIDILLSAKMIYKNISGFYKPHDTIVIKDTSPSITWASYMSENISLAKEAIFNVPKSERDISAITIGLSDSNFEIACQKIKELRKYLLSLSENDTHVTTIYQANFQLFPLTKSSKDA